MGAATHDVIASDSTASDARNDACAGRNDVNSPWRHVEANDNNNNDRAAQVDPTTDARVVRVPYFEPH